MIPRSRARTHPRSRPTVASAVGGKVIIGMIIGVWTGAATLATDHRVSMASVMGGRETGWVIGAPTGVRGKVLARSR